MVIPFLQRQQGASLLEVMISMLLMAWVACGTMNALGLTQQLYEKTVRMHSRSMEHPVLDHQLVLHRSQLDTFDNKSSL